MQASESTSVGPWPRESVGEGVRGLGDETPPLQGPQRMRARDQVIDASLLLALLDTLLEAVDGSLFVVGGDGRIVGTNARGQALLEDSADAAHALLATGTAALPSPSADSKEECATWSLGSLRAWRRCFVTGAGASYALVVVESLATSLDEVHERAVNAWALTTRQAEVLRIILEGRSNKELATDLEVAERTVEAHLTAIFEKAGVDSRARLIANAWALGRPGRFRL